MWIIWLGEILIIWKTDFNVIINFELIAFHHFLILCKSSSCNVRLSRRLLNLEKWESLLCWLLSNGYVSESEWSYHRDLGKLDAVGASFNSCVSVFFFNCWISALFSLESSWSKCSLFLCWRRWCWSSNLFFFVRSLYLV